MLPTITWDGGAVVMIDQRVLPAEETYIRCRSVECVAEAIETMVIRGAPAIGVAAAYGLALGVGLLDSEEHLDSEFTKIYRRLERTRPTARNLFWALERMKRVFDQNRKKGLADLKKILLKEAKSVDEEDVVINRRLGAWGKDLVPARATVLTHCNAGALATSGYGTALGVIRAAHTEGKSVRVYADETRPFLQGARLTVWELDRDGIPVSLITDNMAGWLMKKGEISIVITGADRIAANGDAANKIGTYSVALLAREHGIPFYVAAPMSTIDLSLKTGDEIPIEERDPDEVRTAGGCLITLPHISVRNPAFDVTPAGLIAAIITENGIARAPYEDSLAALAQTEGSSR
jgi:methylthioribose-1-phosphate isomerase